MLNTPRPPLTREQREELRQQIMTSRDRNMARLATDYRESADRLLAAYQDALPSILRTIDSLPDDLNPLYDGDAYDNVGGLYDITDRIAREINVLQSVITDESARMQALGINAGMEGGIANLNAGGMRVGWGEISPQTIRAGINYVDSTPFREAVERLGQYHAGRVENLILTGIGQGANPRAIALSVREYFTESQAPMVDAYRMVQTTQIYSYRRGTQAVYQETGVREWIWSAAIGSSRTCRACIAMHGTVHPTTEVLNDHHQGRCAMVPVTPTWRELGFADGGEVPIETGVDWFNRQDEETQRRAVGNNLLFEAIQRGEVAFSPDTIVGVYDNPIFGEMRRARSFREIIGQ